MTIDPIKQYTDGDFRINREFDIYQGKECVRVDNLANGWCAFHTFETDDNVEEWIEKLKGMTK